MNGEAVQMLGCIGICIPPTYLPINLANQGYYSAAPLNNQYQTLI